MPRLNLAYFFWPQRQAAGHVTMSNVRCSSTAGDVLNFKFRPLPTLFQTHDSLADFHFPQVEDFLALTFCNLSGRFFCRVNTFAESVAHSHAHILIEIVAKLIVVVAFHPTTLACQCEHKS